MEGQSLHLNILQKELQRLIIEKVKASPSILSNDVTNLIENNWKQSYFVDQDIFIRINRCSLGRIAQGSRKDIRSLNDLKKWDGKLVEFTYMVQSMFDPELYTVAAIDTEAILTEASDKSVEVFKYHDYINYPPNLENHDQDEFNENVVSALSDRSMYYAIPIQNKNKWIHKKQQQNVTLEIEQQNQEEIKSITYKGLHISSGSDVNIYGQELRGKGVFNYSEKAYQFSYPCILKYYSIDSSVTPKLNDIVKVTGILSYELPSNEDLDSNSEENFEQTYNHFYPEGLVPRVHVLKSSTVNYQSIQQGVLTLLPEVKQFHPEETRERLLQLLTSILGGDQQVGIYLLMTLISSVNLTKDKEQYGKIILNITNIQQKLPGGNKISDTLIYFLESILSHSVTIPFTLSYFSKVNIGPNPQDQTNIVEYGEVQLPKEAKMFVISDQTSIETGQLQDKGLRNVNHMLNLFQNLKVIFESSYYKSSVDTDISGVVLSEGKGLFHSDIQIKLLKQEQEGSQHSDNLNLFEDEGFLDRIRKYILECKLKALTVQLDQQVADNIQTDFVLKRKNQQNDVNILKEVIINQESLERWIQLCRLNAATKMKQYATIEDYKEIKELEEHRIQRIVHELTSKKE